MSEFHLYVVTPVALATIDLRLRVLRDADDRRTRREVLAVARGSIG